MDGEAIYRNFWDGPGGGRLRQSADEVNDLVTVYNDLGDAVAQAANAIDDGWRGDAAGAAGRGAGPLAMEFMEASPHLGTAKDLSHAQVNTFNDVKQSVQQVPVKPEAPSGWSNFYSGVEEAATLGMADTAANDYENDLAKHNAAAQHNVDQMKFYAKSSEHNTTNMPQTYGAGKMPDAPDVSIANREVGGSGGNFGHQFSGAGAGTQAAAAGAGPSGGPYAGGGPTPAVSGGGNPSGVGGPAGPGGVPGTAPAGPGGPGGGSFGTGPAGYGTTPSGLPGSQGGYGSQPAGGSGALGGIGGFGANTGAGQDSTRRSGGYGGSAFGSTGAAPTSGVAGPGGTFGPGGVAGTGGPGAGGAGAGGAAGTGQGGRLGVGGVPGEAAAARGAGPAGAAGARGGMAPGMMPPGARGQGDEDTEHETPDYLVDPDPDETFAGDLPRTAPPVIGE